MTEARPVVRRRRSRRASRLRRWALLALAFAVVFAVGLALGRVTSTDPEPDDTRVTTVRTIVPLASTRDTVTVTTTVATVP